jgi:hypothetical protein
MIWCRLCVYFSISPATQNNLKYDSEFYIEQLQKMANLLFGFSNFLGAIHPLEQFQCFFVENNLRILSQNMDLTWVKELSLADIHSILAIVELNDATVTIPDGLIVADRKTLQMLDQTSLEVATATGFHGSINQTLKEHQKSITAVSNTADVFTSRPAMQWKKNSGGWIPVMNRPSMNPPALGLVSNAANEGSDFPEIINGGLLPSNSI